MIFVRIIVFISINISADEDERIQTTFKFNKEVVQLQPYNNLQFFRNVGYQTKYPYFGRLRSKTINS